MEEIVWYRVKIYLTSSAVLQVDLTEDELIDLKENIKRQHLVPDEYDLYFESKHPASDRILVDVREIDALMETKEFGDD